MSHISSRLKRLLAIKGITQTELAKRASITQGAVSKYINGLREPNSHELYAISKALDVSMESWFTGLQPPAGAGEDGNWKSRATNAERKLRRLRAAGMKFYKELENDE